MAVDKDTFRYRRYFLNISDDDVTEAILEVSAAWGGTQLLWSEYTDPSRQSMRDGVMHLLVAWHLADFFPLDLEGIASNGGMPIVMKSIGGVDIKFMPTDVQPGLYPLMSNTFGIRAMQMVLSAPERFGIHGSVSSLVVNPQSGTGLGV